GKQGQPFTFAAGRATRWAGIHIPVDHPSLAPELLKSLSGKGGTHTQTQLRYVVDTRRLVSRLFANDASVMLAHPAAARAAEEEIVAITSHALEASKWVEPRRIGRPRFPRGRIVSR